jgi:ribosomal protein S18 acetylase RimI-like enzyme
MIEFRPFHNTDPPRISQLWNDACLGFGAALDFPNEALDMLVLSEHYFDRQGLIVAMDDGEAVGFVHAGFGFNAEGTGISFEEGVICAVIVRNDFRRQGLGRQLVARAEEYLIRRGAKSIYAGESNRRNPFYLGLYGGAESVGFLESDKNADPFFKALGYEPLQKYELLRRSLVVAKEPFDPRGVAIKRTMKLAILDTPPGANWWWMTRYGRFESLSFVLAPNSGGTPPALVSCWGMEFHAQTRGERTVGITGLSVDENERRKGLGRTLVSEMMRRLREDLVGQAEVAVRADDPAGLGLFQSLGFTPFDTGVVYRKRPAP